MTKLTAEQVRTAIEADVERLFASWMVGRPENYVVDRTTKAVVATGYWLDEQLATFCNDADRKTQNWKFNRLSRSQDPFDAAVEVLNEALEGNVEQNRKPHRRWG